MGVLLTSMLSHWIIVPKLTRLQRQYLGSSESITLPSSSTSTSRISAPPAAFLLVALALFFLGAAFRLPTALFPPEFVLLITPGAGRLARLLAGLEVVGSCRSGAGVFRAVLARRGRSAARDGGGSWLVAFPPRDAGRRAAAAVGAVEADCASDSANGVAGIGVAARDGGVGSSFTCSCFRAVAFLVSRTGGRIGVVDFLGDDARGGTAASSPGASVVVAVAFGEATAPMLGAGEVPDIVPIGWSRPGIGTGMGVVDCGPTTVPPGVSCVRGAGVSWFGCDVAVVLGVSCG